MLRKSLVIVLLLCIIHASLSKPTASKELTEGRGIVSTIWGYITYPFTFWRYSEPDPVVTNIGTTTYGPNDIIEIGKHNVTIWCNDQTCTTMKCDKIGCRNISCSIYDTDMTGECREYNTLNPEETPSPPVTPKPFENKVTQATAVVASSVSPTPAPTTIDNNPKDEHLLELEQALSSTIEVRPKDPVETSSVEKPRNKI
ncbi:uncharacterized protein LOC115445232 [Manduca sexta]|uniref:uncharacterized protein LOC115445232 n=1 Tax=Manduca sexta TaxID=7130 RepID=UPI001183441A|nr:uncharacterized protein LOC115445232 [Manduca sexta]